MSPAQADRNRALIHELFERVINAHELTLVDSLYRSDYLQHNPAAPQGVAGLKQFLTLLFTAFPDLRGTIVSTVSEGDRVTALVDWTATHSGNFAGIAPTGRAIRFRSAEIFRIADGRFAEHWDVVDNVEMQLALGLLHAVRR